MKAVAEIPESVGLRTQFFVSRIYNSAKRGLQNAILRFQISPLCKALTSEHHSLLLELTILHSVDFRISSQLLQGFSLGF